MAAGATYTLTVTATDGGTSALTDTASVTIYVLSTTTAAPTVAAAAATAASSGSDSSDFFDSTGNIILLALAAFTALMIAAIAGLLVWRSCVNPTVGGGKT